MRVIKGRMKPINLSFAACGFLGIYHLGAASAFCKHGKRLLKDVQAFAGASAGSLVASVLLTAPEKIEDCNRFTYQLAEETRKQSFGAVTPGYDFMARLRSGMESILPPHAHELAQDRLYVSITNTRTRQNYLVSRFPSREDLIKVLLASSFVPIYAGLRPVEYQGQVKHRFCFTHTSEVGLPSEDPFNLDKKSLREVPLFSHLESRLWPIRSNKYTQGIFLKSA
ncbi:patatin-like phospholipase domain-containing protein 4 isoform X5 [Ictidomys tridecemlineatus]